MKVVDGVLHVDTALEWVSLFLEIIVDNMNTDTWYIFEEDEMGIDITSITLDCPLSSHDKDLTCAINWATSDDEMRLALGSWDGYHGYVGIRHIVRCVCEKKNVKWFAVNFDTTNTYYPGSPEFELVSAFLTSLRL